MDKDMSVDEGMEYIKPCPFPKCGKIPIIREIPPDPDNPDYSEWTYRLTCNHGIKDISPREKYRVEMGSVSDLVMHWNNIK